MVVIVVIVVVVVVFVVVVDMVVVVVFVIVVVVVVVVVVADLPLLLQTPLLSCAGSESLSHQCCRGPRTGQSLFLALYLLSLSVSLCNCWGGCLLQNGH